MTVSTQAPSPAIRSDPLFYRARLSSENLEPWLFSSPAADASSFGLPKLRIEQLAADCDFVIAAAKEGSNADLASEGERLFAEVLKGVGLVFGFYLSLVPRPLQPSNADSFAGTGFQNACTRWVIRAVAQEAQRAAGGADAALLVRVGAQKVRELAAKWEQRYRAGDMQPWAIELGISV